MLCTLPTAIVLASTVTLPAPAIVEASRAGPGSQTPATVGRAVAGLCGAGPESQTPATVGRAVAGLCEAGPESQTPATVGRDVAGRCEAGWDLFREVESDAQWWRSATGEFAPSLRAGDEEEMGELSLLEEFRRRTPWLTHGEDNPDTDPIQRLREKQRKAIAEGLDRRSPARPGGIREDLKPPSQLDNPAVGPVPGERWQTGDSVEVFDAGVFKVYGQLGGGYVTLPSQQLLWSGTTCLGAKVQPLDGAEIQVRGGPRASYREDPVRPDRVFTASPGMLFEVQARYNLLGPVNVEYQWMAMPALDPLERNRLWQDLRFAIPVGARGHFRVGARHEWETFNEVPARGARARPLADSTELYLGFGLRR